jgi:hypothetical protein
LRYVRIDKFVPNTDPVLAAADDSRLVKDGQMLGDVLLDSIDGADELLHSGGAVAEAVDQLEP